MKRQSTMIGAVYACSKCDADDPLKSPEVARLLTGELRPIKHIQSGTTTIPDALAAQDDIEQ
jgi:hypothetical protein